MKLVLISSILIVLVTIPGLLIVQNLDSSASSQEGQNQGVFQEVEVPIGFNEQASEEANIGIVESEKDEVKEEPPLELPVPEPSESIQEESSTSTFTSGTITLKRTFASIRSSMEQTAEVVVTQDLLDEAPHLLRARANAFSMNSFCGGWIFGEGEPVIE